MKSSTKPCSFPNAGWSPSGTGSWKIPNGSDSTLLMSRPATVYANSATMERELGIGRPSKWEILPVESFGKRATVALKRARRARPQHTKYVNPKASRLVRIPTAKAKAAGANPNDICRTGVLESLASHAYQLRTKRKNHNTKSAKLSSSWPSLDENKRTHWYAISFVSPHPCLNHKHYGPNENKHTS